MTTTTKKPTARERGHCKLSALQRAILADLLAYYRNVESAGDDFVKSELKHRGVPLMWLRGRKRGWSNAQSAAFSRSLLRLEFRGFVLRVNAITLA
jgi:hypothetical protein